MLLTECRNVWDFQGCPVDEAGKTNCTTPLFSFIKRQQDADVLVPPLGLPKFETHWVPWEQKLNQAFFRQAARHLLDP
jgi:hypothetical protein